MRRPDSIQTPIVTDEIRPAEKKAADGIGSSLLIGLTTFFGVELALILTRQRPFHRFWLACLLASALCCYLASTFSPAIRKKIRRGVFVSILVSAALFLWHNRLPVTSVSVTLRSMAGPTDFLLRQFFPGRRDRFKTVYGAPSREAVAIAFSLPAAVRGHRRALEIYFGRAPKSYDILKISFGTRVLGRPIPLATFRGADMLQVAGTPKTVNRFTLIGGAARLASKGHVRPTLNIASDENFIRRNIPASRVYVVKLLWFLLCAGFAGLIIWHHKLTWLKIPRKEALIAYLTR